MLSFAKNSGLGFAIPYFHNGQRHDYIPDFLLCLDREEPRYLILETKGYDPLEDVKRSAATRWVDAVNADGRHGTWSYCIAKKVSQVLELIDDAVSAMPASTS